MREYLEVLKEVTIGILLILCAIAITLLFGMFGGYIGGILGFGIGSVIGIIIATTTFLFFIESY